MKDAILAVLAAASLAACGANDEPKGDEKVDDESAISRTSPTLPFPFPAERGCVSAPRDGELYRVRAMDARNLELQVYDASTGALLRATTFFAQRVGDIIRLGTFSSNAPDASSAEIRRETTGGTTRTILTLARFGEAPREVDVTCDVDAGLDKIQNPVRLAFATSADDVSPTTTFGALRASACTAPAPLSQGPLAGAQVRVGIRAARDPGAFKARVEFVDPTTHFVVGYFDSNIRQKATGYGYELVDSYTNRSHSHISVGSDFKLTLRSEEPTLKTKLAGDVAIDCEIVGP